MDKYLSPNARSVLFPDRRCTATAKHTGKRCNRSSSIGAFVCDQHGGKTPWSIQASKERMEGLAEPAIEVLRKATRSAPPCTGCGHVNEKGETCIGCGRSDADRDPTAVRAAQIILDRTGFHPTLALEAKPTSNPYQDLTDDQLIEKLEAMLAEAREVRDQRNALPLDAYEVLEDDDAVRSTPPEESQQEPQESTKEDPNV